MSAQAYFEDLNDWVKVMKAETPVVAPAQTQPVRQGRGTTDSELATLKKEEGNQHVKGGRWREAIEAYDAGLKYLGGLQNSDSLKSVLLANRSLCRLKLSEFQAALADASSAVSADAGNSKALFRQGQVLAKMGKFQEAKGAFSACLEISADPEVDLEIGKVSNILEKDEEERRWIARRILTDKNRVPKLPLFDLEISVPVKIEEKKLEISSQKSTYVPRSARFAVAEDKKISNSADFEKAWTVKADRPGILKDLEISIFRENLEIDIFSEILECACTELEISSALTLLESLTKIRRFSILVSLLSKSDRARILDFLKNEELAEKYLK